MTPLRCAFDRFVLTLSTGILLAAAAPPPHARAASRTARETVAYVPSAIWGDYLETATAGLGLTPHAIYWFEGMDSSMGRIIGDLERYEADDARAAPREPLVAFAGRYAANPSTTLVPGVAVMDTTGALVADFPGARSYAWSPDGTRLAVLFPRAPFPAPKPRMRIRALERAKRAQPARNGVSIWDRRDGTVRSFKLWPSRAAWARGDSLLLQLPDSVLLLDPRSGTTARTGHNGTIVSPDSRYAIRPGENGADTRIYDEERGEPITDALFAPFHEEDKSQIRSAFWTQGRGADHLMVICGCDGIQYPAPSCSTRLVDVETGQVLASFRGEALGPTADGRGVVVFRRDSGRLVDHDLRPVVRERDGGSGRGRQDARDRDSGRDQPSGGFY